MNTLELLPDQEGYAVDFGKPTLSNRQNGPLSFVGRISRNEERTVNVSWTLTGDEYETLWAFYSENKAISFLMDLFLQSSELTTCICKFQSLKMDSIKSETYKISGMISAIPQYVVPPDA